MSESLGGTETFIMTRFRALQNLGFHFDFLTNTPHIAFEDEIRASGSRIIRISQRKTNRFAFYRDLRNLFSSHAAQYKTIWYNANNLANIDYLIYAKKYGINKRIIHCHNSANPDNPIRGFLHVCNRKRISSVATHFWSASDAASGWFYGENFRDLPNYTVIPNAIDIKHFQFNENERASTRKNLNLSEDSIVIGNIGRLHFQKNQKFLLQVFQTMLKNHPKAELILLGEGPLKADLQKESDELGISQRVHFAGVVANPAPYYSAMDLFLFPSVFEALPISLLEAQANGVPCLVSNASPAIACVNPNIFRMDLKEDVAQWSRHASILLTQARINNTDNLMNQSQYDIQEQVEWLKNAL